MTNLKLSIMVAALVLSSLGCTLLRVPKDSPLANHRIEVRGDKIYRNGEIFAELRYLFLDSSGDAYRGLAIYYYPSRQEVWIYPEGGWQIRGDSKPHYTVREIEEAQANKESP